MKEKPVWGIQFHPEIDVDEARELLRLMIKNGVGKTEYFERALSSYPRDSGRIKTIVHNFLNSSQKES